jgi:hypothetical protein
MKNCLNVYNTSMVNRLGINPFLSKCLNYLTPDRIFRFPKLLGFLHSLLTWVVCIGAKKRFYREISKGSATHPIKISGKIIAQAIFNSNGKIRIEVKTKLLGSKTPEITSQNHSKFFDNAVVGDALAELKNSNYAKVGNISSSNEFKELIELLKSPVYSSKQKKDLKYSSRAILEVDQPNLQEDFIWNVSPERVWKNHGFREILHDSFWQTIADNYLGGHSKIISFRFWHSYAHANSENLSPENWHTDASDGLNFIKFFVLLTDVTDENGPTAVIPLPLRKIPRRFISGRRYSDYEVQELCHNKKIEPLKATGSIGTIYVADTRGLHRGSPLLKGHRCLFSFTASTDYQYGIDISEKYNINDGIIDKKNRFQIFSRK